MTVLGKSRCGERLTTCTCHHRGPIRRSGAEIAAQHREARERARVAGWAGDALRDGVEAQREATRRQGRAA